jgi:hypothetical protein
VVCEDIPKMSLNSAIILRYNGNTIVRQARSETAYCIMQSPLGDGAAIGCDIY